jgi:hypothetical protein
MRIRKGEETRYAEENVKKSVRIWLSFRGFGGEALTNEGIDGLTVKVGKSRAMAKLTREQRARVMAVIDEKTRTNWVPRNGKFGVRKEVGIPFEDQPRLALAIKQLPKVAFYTGTRIGQEKRTGLLSQRWGANEVKFEGDVVVLHVVDKGKRGGLEWFKKLVGKPAVEFQAFYEAVGRPESGPIFPFEYKQLLAFLQEVYEDAQIPKEAYEGMTVHIWRHTGAQEMLDATEWNYGLVASTLGWDGTQALEDHYGKMPSTAQLRGLRKAMGLPVSEVKGEFVF